MVDSREEERAISKQVVGGEMLEYGEVMKRRFVYLDIVAKVVECLGCDYVVTVFDVWQTQVYNRSQVGFEIRCRHGQCSVFVVDDARLDRCKRDSGIRSALNAVLGRATTLGVGMCVGFQSRGIRSYSFAIWVVIVVCCCRLWCLRRSVDFGM